MTHYIFLNGPPKSGRTRIADMLCHGLNARALEACVVIRSLSMPLKGFWCASLAQPWEQFDDDTPRAVLNGISGHLALRKLREHVRAVYGPDALGRWLEHRVLGLSKQPGVVVVDDLLHQDDFDRFAHYGRTLIHTGRGASRQDGFTWLHPADFVMENYNGLSGTLKQVKEIVEKLEHA